MINAYQSGGGKGDWLQSKRSEAPVPVPFSTGAATAHHLLRAGKRFGQRP